MIYHAHRNNIRVIGITLTWWDTEAARLHPDWMAEEAGRHDLL